MLSWHSFSELDIYHTVYLFADNCCEYAVYNAVQQSTTQITNDAKPKVVDSLLMLICMMGQEVCSHFFGL